MSRFMRLLHGPVYEARLRELVRRMVPLLQAGDRVLDVGCGFGALGRAILDAPGRPPDVSVRGLERVPRGGEMLEVDAYDGGAMPYPDRAFDVVILADVLHHEPDPHRLLQECARVARRLVIVKDHKIDGPLARWRIAFIDWAANAPYGVPCLYRYNSPAAWRAAFERLQLPLDHEAESMNLYPAGVNLLFGRRLQYFAVLRVDGRRGHEG